MATAGAGLAAGAKGVGLADHKRLLDDHAKRVRDTHRLQMRSLGLELPETEDEDMGDVIVTGDITITPPPESAASDPKPTRPASRLLPYALAATAALAGGGLGAGLMALANRPAAPVAPIVTGDDTDTQYELRISSGEVEP